MAILSSVPSVRRPASRRNADAEHRISVTLVCCMVRWALSARRHRRHVVAVLRRRVALCCMSADSGVDLAIEASKRRRSWAGSCRSSARVGGGATKGDTARTVSAIPLRALRTYRPHQSKSRNRISRPLQARNLRPLPLRLRGDRRPRQALLGSISKVYSSEYHGPFTSGAGAGVLVQLIMPISRRVTPNCTSVSRCGSSRSRSARCAS